MICYELICDQCKKQWLTESANCIDEVIRTLTSINLDNDTGKAMLCDDCMDLWEQEQIKKEIEDELSR